MKCPCDSGLSYTECCEPFHRGKEPSTPLQLMRSRYSAYALGQVDYIQKTTHPQSPHFDLNTARWRKQIETSCRTTKFCKLEILGAADNWVSFVAYLQQEGKPFLLQETSEFQKVGSHWRYLQGVVKIDQ